MSMYAQTRAATIAATRIPALPDSVRRNARNGAVTCLVVHGVRSEAGSVTRRFCPISLARHRPPTRIDPIPAAEGVVDVDCGNLTGCRLGAAAWIGWPGHTTYATSTHFPTTTQRRFPTQHRAAC